MTLTEQWKKGELETGCYYVKNEFGHIFISDYSENYDYIEDKVVKDFFIEVTEITEIIAPVPSYEEWQELNEDVNTTTELWRNTESQLNEKVQLIGKLAEQKQQLKGLLKECREIFGRTSYTHKFDMVAKIDNAIGEKK